MRDLLVRYVLDELTVEQRELVESKLRESPELQRELDYLRGCLAPESPGDKGPPTSPPPRGLAERTVERITDSAEGRDAAVPVATATDRADEPAATPYWSFVDLVVAGGVLLAVSMLFLPALRQSRDASRRTVCADNLRHIGNLLALYSEEHGRYYPLVRQSDNAGIFAVHLVDKDYISAGALGRRVVCRSSPLADQVAEGEMVVRIPTVVELRAAAGERLADFRRLMGGSYAYRIGYVEGQGYYNLRDRRCPHTPLMADTPSFQLAGLKSANHGGCGQNVLYQDQSVRYQHSCELDGRDDHLFLNAEGVPAAGCGKFDTVLGRSEATPGVVAREALP